MEPLDKVAANIGRTTLFSPAEARRELQRLTDAGVSIDLADRALRLGITVDHVRIIDPTFGLTS